MLNDSGHGIGVKNMNVEHFGELSEEDDFVAGAVNGNVLCVT